MAEKATCSDKNVIRKKKNAPTNVTTNKACYSYSTPTFLALSHGFFAEEAAAAHDFSLRGR